MSERCLHCGRGDLCPPCAEGNPPYDRHDYEPHQQIEVLAACCKRGPHSTEQVREQLAEIPDLMAEVSYYIEPGSAPIDPDARHRHGNLAKLPLVAAVADLLDERQKDLTDPEDLPANRKNGERRLGVLRTLGLWVSLIHPELEDTEGETAVCCPGREHTISGECSWLIQHLDFTMGLHPDFGCDISAIWRDLRNQTRTVDAGPLRCLIETCGWPVEEMSGGAWYRCTGCRRSWSRLELHKLHEQQKPKTLSEIAALTQIPLSTLKDWAKRRWIKPAVRDGKSLYSLTKVQAFAVKTQKGRKDKANA